MDRVAVVTGANRGLGFATARALGKLGYRVILTARSWNDADAATRVLEAAHLDVIPKGLDVSSDESVDAMFDFLDNEYGRLDVLVNNAGAVFERKHTGRWDAGVFEVPAQVVQESFNTNSLGAYRMMAHALPRMNDAGFGRIVNVTSGMGALTDMGGGYPAYRMSKAALNAATRVFAHEAGDNVKVNCVCPGWVKTDMGGSGATRELEDGVAGIVWAATLPDDGPNNGFFRDREPVAW